MNTYSSTQMVEFCWLDCLIMFILGHGAHLNGDSVCTISFHSDDIIMSIYKLIVIMVW